MVVRELSIAEPIVDLRAFHDRNFTVGCIYSFILGIGIYTVLYLLPIYLANVNGLNSLQIGQYLAVTGAFQFVSAVAAGMCAQWLDSRVMLAIGLAIFGLGAWLNGFMTYDWGFWDFFLPQALRGFSMMFIFLPINALALGTLPEHEVQNASGLYNLMRNLGGAMGLAFANTLIVNWQKEFYAEFRSSVTAGETHVMQMWQQLTITHAQHLSADPERAALTQLSQLAWREADIVTSNQVFQLMALIFFGSLFIMPLVRKVSMSASPGGH
jgi:MFS transporter, DHA2 family, multidrug resistance protein